MTKGNMLLSALLAVGLAVGGTVGAQAATTFKFASEAPRSDSQFLGGEKFNELLKAKTKGALEVKTYSDSMLGNAQAAITGARGGTIDILVSGSANFNGLEPELGMFDIPFLFKDSDHAYRVLDGEVGQAMLDKLSKVGLKGLAYWDNGWRQISNSRGPVRTPADIKGLKLRTSSSPVQIEAFKLLGANPVPMPVGELYTALEMKTVDAQEHPLGVFVSSKFYEVQKYLSLSQHAYSPLIVAMNKAKFDALPADQQKAVLEAAREAGKYQRQLNATALKEQVELVKKNGVQVIEKIDPAPFAAATKSVRENFISKVGGEAEIKKIDALRDAK